MLTVEALRAVGATAARAAEVLEPLKASCALYDITTPERLAAFLAQVGHESGGFKWASEIWGPTPAQERYEGRADLGNTQPGDGSRFRGHGFIQTTGRHNHARVRDRLRERLSIEVPDFEAEPEKLADLHWACLSAADYWDMRGLNALADAGDFLSITKRINGGINGLADRRARWEKVKAILIPEIMVSFTLADTIPPNPFASQEHSMPFPIATILTAALPALIEAVPKLGTLFSSGSETSQRNLKAAETVFTIAKEALGAVNEQQVVDAIESDPQAAAAVKAAIEAKWFEITEVGGGIQAARAAAEKYTAPGAAGFWLNPAFWISLVLIAMPFLLLVDVFFVHPDKYAENLLTQIVTGVLMVIGMVGGFWLGSSMGSAKKTDMLGK